MEGSLRNWRRQNTLPSTYGREGRISLSKNMFEKLRIPQHFQSNSSKIQLEEAYQGQYLILEYDSENCEYDKPRLRM